MLRYLVTILCFFSLVKGYCQSISGFIFDENNTPIPYANIYIKNLQKGTSSDAEGKYFYQFTEQNIYDIVVTAVGFETQEFKVIIDDNQTEVKNVWLKQDVKVLNEVLIKEKKRDPAYEIINNAIKNREKWDSQIEKSSCNVYIKAKEVISEREKKRREKIAQQKKIAEQNKEENLDVFDNSKKENEIPQNSNMTEIEMVRYYQYPNKVKEVRNAVKKYGSSYGLFFTNTIENEFNFYDGLMSLPKLNEVPLVSPLNSISFITYKFELEETSFINGKMLFKIKMTPRKRGNSTFRGYLWIMDETFHIHKVDFTLKNDGLLIYDEFNVQQEYQFISDSTLVKKKQVFTYSSKNRKQNFNGSTVVEYSNYNLNPNIPKRFFSNEVGVTTKEAYKRDSSYWDKIRPEPLTKEEQRYQKVKDSLYEVTHSGPYLDSLDSVFNRITFLDVVWDGFRFTNRKKKTYWGVSSLAALIDPFEVGGIRLGPYLWYFKKFENEQTFRASGQFNMGVLNADPKGFIDLSYRYDPINSGYLNVYAGKQFDLVVMNDAISNLLVRNNWIENDQLSLGHSREYVNGFFIGTAVNFSNRQSIEDYNFVPLYDSLFGDNSVEPFTDYQATTIDVEFSYTPFQKYMREPNRKIILGSRWPTFSVLYKKGIPELFGSDINFDFVEGEIKQTFQVGTLGTSSYKLSGGQFINTADLRYVDYKIFPRGDKWFFASLMQSMQIQDTSLNVTDSYLKAHFTHHFNGSVINFLPLIKRLGIHSVVGTSALYIKESNYRYFEWFAGIERTFKIDRRRLRLGVYGVDAVSNYSSIQPRIKFAINFYSIRDNSWGY